MSSSRPGIAQKPVVSPQQRWHDLLQAPANPGLNLLESAGGPVLAAPTEPSAEAAFPAEGSDGFFCALTDLAVLQVSGADAESFLQGQLTNDVASLTAAQVQRTGLCSPKGRLLADFLIFRHADSFCLLVSQQIAETMRKRLSMFVMRAKVTVSDISDDLLALGLITHTESAQPPAGLSLPASLTVLVTQAGPGEPESPAISIGLESVDHHGYRWRRAICLLSPAAALKTLNDCQQQFPLAPTAWWHTGEVLAGTPRLTLATTDAFVPQMINFELVGGVSFTKGCYPGQEIVARTQYLGKLKRRLSLGSVESAEPFAPGAELVDESGNTIGVVLLVGPGLVPASPVRQWLLFEARTAELDSAAEVRIGTIRVSPQGLPYEIPVTERFERPDL